VHDAEELERVGGAHDQVVVRVEARVEVEGAEAAGAQQLDDDKLDVGAGRVVAGVEADDGAGAERRRMRRVAPLKPIKRYSGTPRKGAPAIKRIQGIFIAELMCRP